MFRKHLLIGAAACAALTCAGLTRAATLSTADITVKQNVVLLDDTGMATTMPAPEQPGEKPAAAAGGGTSETTATAPTLPLNNVLNHGIRFEDGAPHVGNSDAVFLPHYGDLGINITGYVEGSWTYAARPPANNALTDRAFDNMTESIELNAVDLAVIRSLDASKSTFDFGFTLEGLYGRDGSFIHSNGLTFYGGTGGLGGLNTATSSTFAASGPRNQVDLVQANVSIRAPLGHGIVFEGGKFNTLVGYEVIDAPLNPLYSHSYIFTQEPFTQTGLLASYNLCDPAESDDHQCIMTAGFSRGWDQATEDNNGNLDIIGQIKMTAGKSASPSSQMVFTVISGNENPSPAPGTPGMSGWRTLLDLNGFYQFGDGQITLGYNGMYAFQNQNSGIVATAAGPIQDRGIGQWYGAALYAQWKPCSYLAFNLRGEWFDDQDGVAPTQLAGTGATNISNQFYEVTFGATIKPFAESEWLNGLAIRPEVRWDYSNHRAFSIDGLGNPGHHDLLTGAVEAYFAF